MPKMVLVCLNCNEEFEIDLWRYRDGRRKFCSRRCKGRWWHKESKPITKVCPICGKIFLKFPRELKYSRGKFCSKECYHRSTRNKIIKKCILCKKEFSSTLSHHRKFCSKKCSAEARIGIKRPQEFSEKLRLANLGKKLSIEHRAKLSEAHTGPRNVNWKGGPHRKKYCFKFNEALKAEIREEHEHKCFLCLTIQKSPGLNIHHIDYNHNGGCKNQQFALLPLCSRCHGKTSWNKWYYFNLLIYYWAMNPDISLCSFPFASF